jgi:NACalpha-BTF3-like transcription factor
MAENDMADARAKMIAKRFGGSSTSTGGKGSIRRKKKVANRSSSAQSDAKLSTTLKKLGATNIPGIEEVNFFKEDGKVIHFKNPKVQASIAANTYIISGPSETKPLQDLLPSIVSPVACLVPPPVPKETMTTMMTMSPISWKETLKKSLKSKTTKNNKISPTLYTIHTSPYTTFYFIKTTPFSLAIVLL